MIDRTRGVAALLAAAVALSAAAPSADAATVPLRRCAPGSSTDRTRCGTVTVPLDRGGAVGGEVRLRVRVLDPVGGRAKETVLALAGGPGQAATPLVEAFAQTLGDSLERRRLVTFDQRGTGRSGRLSCPSLARATGVDSAISACAERIGPARTAYTTAASVEDVEAVRAALGADKLVLFGVSYGTKVALDYAARHPERVSRMVLDSVVPPSGNDPFMRSTFASVGRVLNGVCGRRGCPFTRDPAADVATLVKRMARGPVRGTWYDGRGRPRPASLDSAGLLGVLLSTDFAPLARVALPAALHAAAKGDPAQLLRLARSSASGGLERSQDSDALFLATTCLDGGVPWPAGTPVGERRAATGRALAAVPDAQLAPFDRSALRGVGLLELCRAWPESPVAQPSPPLPAVPTLILSGDDDLRTPREDALALAASMPSAKLVTVRGTGHSVLSSELGSCTQGVVRAFLAGRPVRSCHRGMAFLRLHPPAPRSLAQVEPLRGQRGRAGRTVAAVAATIAATDREIGIGMFDALMGDDALLEMRAGGLRGGWMRVSDEWLVLHRYSYVPGVTVSMRWSSDNSDAYTIRVGGRAAARGTLLVGDDHVSGTLGGRPVRLPVRRFVRASTATATEAAESSLAEALAGLRATAAASEGVRPPLLPPGPALPR